MKCRILVVEDSATQAAALEGLLLDAGHEPVVARSAEEALGRVGEGFDLILSDVVMPGLSGYELCRRLKDDPDTRSLPVVLLTSLADPMDIVRGLEAGADNYITKPYEGEHLLARVGHVLHTRRLRPATRTSMGVTVNFLGSELTITSDKEQILDLLLSSVEDVIRINRKLEESRRELEEAHRKLTVYSERRLEESDQRFRSLFDYNPDAIYSLDLEGRFTSANPSCTRITGYDPAELLGTSFVRLLEPEDFERVQAHFLQALRGEPQSFEVAIRHRDGHRIRLSITNSPIVVGGEIVGVFGIAEDVTERYRAQAALRESEEMFRTLIDAAPVAIVMLEPTGAVRLWNGGAERIFGWTEQEVLGLPLPIVPEDRAAEFRSHCGRVRRGRTIEGLELRRRRKDGSLVDVSLSAAPLSGVDGEFTGIMGVLVDITERQRSQNAVRESEDRFRALTEHSSDMIVVVDESATIQYVSPSVERTLGYAPPEIVGVDAFTLIRPDDLPMMRESFESRRSESGTGEWLQFQIRHRDGSWRTMEAVGTSLFHHPAIRGLVINARDVTERIRAEEALNESQEQLRQSQKMEAIGQLAGGIAHDFNNLLTVIKGSTDMLLLDVGPGDPLRPDLEEIDQSVDRAANLTRQLLTFSRKQVTEPQVIDLNSVVLHTEKLLRRVLGETIEFTSSLHPGPGAVRADRGQLEQILINLAVNARDAMAGGGRLTISTDRVALTEARAGFPEFVPAGEYTLLSVADTGTGMSPEVRERVFEPFFTTKPTGRGTGIGLSTVYGIVKQSGGFIQLQSRAGEGARFAVYLPELSGPVADADAHGPSISASPGSGTILLVEDEPPVRNITARILERFGYTVHAPATAAAAVAVLEQHAGPLDLVITDVVMPEISGRELGERARARFSGIPILYMSGYTNEAFSQHGVLEAGIDFIQKPFSPDALIRRVQEVMRVPR